MFKNKSLVMRCQVSWCFLLVTVVTISLCTGILSVCFMCLMSSDDCEWSHSSLICAWLFTLCAGNREFIEQRKKALKRFINIIARHPQIYDDKLLKFFLTFTGNVG